MSSGPTGGADVLTHRSAVVLASLPRALLRLGWPAVIASSLEAVFGIVDAVFVGHGLGAVPLAALSTAAFVLWALDALAMAVSIGLTALVAQGVGRQDRDGTQLVVRQGLMLALAASIGVAALGWLFAGAPFVAMGVEPDVAAHGTAYLRVLFGGVATLFVLRAAESIFRGSGNTKLPLVLLVGACSAKVALTPLLIFGVGPFPTLGVAGAALASILAQGAMAVTAVVMLWKRGLLVIPLVARFRPRLATWWQVLRIGLPTALHGVLFCGVYIALARVAATFGTPALAALGVGHKAEAPCYFVAVGLNAAVATLVGQSLGAGLKQRAAKAAWLGVGVGSAFAAAWTALMLLAPGVLVAPFTSNRAVTELAVSYVVIVGLSQVLMVVEIVLDGAFAGAGDTVPPLVVGVPLALARIPLAWLLGSWFGLGAAGIWWAIAVTAMAKGLLLAAWFRKRHDRFA